MLNQVEFVNAHSDEWSELALAMTRQYFHWMNDEIEKTCSFSISDVVGMPLDRYTRTVLNEICPKDHHHAKYYLLVDKQTAVAMGGLRALPSGDAEIVRIYTVPEYRGRGYASSIMRRLIEDAYSGGFKKLKLDTGIFMKDAQVMYAAHGFKPCDPYVGAEPPAALLPYWIFMERDLV